MGLEKASDSVVSGKMEQLALSTVIFYFNLTPDTMSTVEWHSFIRSPCNCWNSMIAFVC